jgi:PAS domain S-box-containing protein
MARILVVDDRKENREFLSTLLGYVGHSVAEAGDGRDALLAARAAPPDLVITDLLMPTMDGFEFVQALRAAPGLADVRVVFYTATYLESDARQLALLCGVRHILTKPAEPEEVLRVVSSVLEVEGVAPPAADPEAVRSEHLRLLNVTLAHKAEVVVPRLKEIVNLTLDLAYVRDPSELLERVCVGARKILGARFAMVGLVKQARPEDGRLFTSGLDPTAGASLAPDWVPGGALGATVADRIPRREGGGRVTTGLPAGFPTPRSLLVAAVCSPKSVYGWLCLADRRGGVFSVEEEQLAAILGGLGGRVYENGSLYSSARRHAEELAKSEQRFRQLAENIPEVFWVAEVEPLRIVYVSPAYETVWGRPVGTLYERPTAWLDPVVAEDQAAVARFFDGANRGETRELEFRILRPDGRTRWIWAKAFPVREGSAPVRRVTGIALDITERKSLDEQFRQAQKMEAIGRLAGGVAHDFNNLLGVIMGYSESTLGILPGDHPGRTKLEQVLKATERAADVTRRLLLFSRKGVPNPRVLDLDQALDDVEKMLRSLIGEDVRIERVRATGPVRILADPGEIGQVVMNLAVNARDAMPRGGRLAIGTSSVEVGAERAGLRPGRYARLTVSDDGAGIPEEIQSRIFEPFFTTKEAGKGTGLGLSTVYGIVQQSGGQVFLESALGRGTTFDIYFPAVDQPAQVGVSPSRESPRGGETILVVEDEEALRSLAQEILESCGYRVLGAANGEAALRVAQTHAGVIDLLLTDVVMPGLGGPDLADRLLRQRPGMRVLFTTGYAPDAVVGRGGLPEGAALVQKPVTGSRLAQMVREILDRP